MTEGKLVPIPARQAIVQRIFAETLSGHGQHAIAQRLTSDGVPCFGRATHWHRTYISKILGNAAAHGVFSPHEYRHEGTKRTRTPLAPIAGYYPPAVTLETFEAVQGGGGTAHRVKARAGQVVSLFGGLATCPICAGTMTRVNKGARATPKLICARAKAGAGCDYRGVDVAAVEDALLSGIDTFLAEAPSGVVGLDERLLELDTTIGVYQDEADNLVQALSHGPSLALTARLRARERELAGVEAERTEVVEKITTGSSPVLMQRLKSVEAALSAAPLNRPMANLLLRSVLASVVVDYPNGRLNFHWKHGGESSLKYAAVFPAARQ